jgi:hypothetical protein
MVQDNNEHKKPEEGSEHLTPSEMEKLKNELKKEHDEAVNLSKKSKAEILHELEKSDNANQKEAVKNMMRQTDFPEMRPHENNSREYEELQKMFAEIQTDHVQYNFLRKLFPSFIRKLENSRLGDNFAIDVAWIPLGGVESLADVAKFSGHLVVDFGELLIQPRVAYERTKSLIW